MANNQTAEKRNQRLRDFYKNNPDLAITKIARIFHLSNTRVRQILKVEIQNNKLKK